MKRAMLASIVTIACVVTTPEPLGSQQRRVVRITAERFTFTPSEVSLETGEEIELRLTSDDTAHGFRIVGTGISLVLPKRGKGEVSVTFRGSEPGRYPFECTRMCGAGHNFMRGVLVVRPPTDPRTRR